MEVDRLTKARSQLHLFEKSRISSSLVPLLLEAEVK